MFRSEMALKGYSSLIEALYCVAGEEKKADDVHKRLYLEPEDGERCLYVFHFKIKLVTMRNGVNLLSIGEILASNRKADNPETKLSEY